MAPAITMLVLYGLSLKTSFDIDEFTEAHPLIAGKGFIAFTIAGYVVGAVGALMALRTTRYKPVDYYGLSAKPEASLGDRILKAQASLDRTSRLVARQVDGVAALLDREFTAVKSVVDELEKELKVRRTILDELAAEVAEAERKADEARALADVHQPSMDAVDAVLDRRLAEHMNASRRSGIIAGIVFTLIGAAASVPAGILVWYLTI